MKRIICYILSISLCIFAWGCSYKKTESIKENQLITENGYEEPENIEGIYVSHNPTPKEMLKENPEADIFLYRDAVALNAKEIDWVKNLKLTKGEVIGQIVYEYKKGEKFKQGMATKLPIGSKVYKAKERSEVLLVEVDGKFIRYLLVIEG